MALRRLSWIKRRTRRLQVAYGTARREAIGEAVMDCNAFHGVKPLLVKSSEASQRRAAA